MNIPFFPFLGFYIFGIITGYYFFLPSYLLTAFLVVISISLVISLVFQRRTLSYILIFSLLMTLGLFRINSSRYPDLPPNHIKNFVSEKKQGLEGILYRPPEYFPDRVRIYLDLTTLHEKERSSLVTGRFLLTINNCALQLDTGDRIRFLSKVKLPSNFGNPGCFDYAGHLAREGIYATGFLPHTRHLAKTGENQSFFRFIGRMRERIREIFMNNMASPSRGIALAMILGDKGDIPPWLRDEFAISGAAHLLAISGLHVGIVAAAAYLLIRWCLRRSYHLTLLISTHNWASFFAIFPVLFYALLSGWTLPTQRAVIMAVAYLTAMILGRERDYMNTLYLAAFIILIFSPSSFFDVSFQLSFVSVFFLIYLIPKISLSPYEEKSLVRLRYQWEAKLFRWLRGSLFATVTATLGTAPLVALYFNRISLVGIPSNLILIPLLGFVTVPLGLIIATLSLISPGLALLFLKLDEQIIDSAIILIRFFAHLPFSELRVTTPSLLEISFFYTGIFLICNFKRTRIFRYAFLCVILFFGIDLLYHRYRDHFNHNLRITFLDGGQGEAALVEFPYGGKMLIDGGGFYRDDVIDVGERAIAPYLWKRRIKKIDYIVLTHPHPDHLHGLPFIAGNFQPRYFWWNGDNGKPGLALKLYEIMGSVKGDSHVLNNRKASFVINGARIDVLSPPPNSPWTGNNNSLVFRISLGEISFLFTGDIEKKAEREITRSRRYLNSTVLKVPHHGSKTSSSEEFIRAVNPEVAVFTGKMGEFLPQPKIVERYKKSGVQTIRIDQRGAITFITNGRSLQVKELKTGIMSSVIP